MAMGMAHGALSHDALWTTTLTYPRKLTLVGFLIFPRHYEVSPPFFSTHSRSLSGMLLMRPFTTWGGEVFPQLKQCFLVILKGFAPPYCPFQPPSMPKRSR